MIALSDFPSKLSAMILLAVLNFPFSEERH